MSKRNNLAELIFLFKTGLSRLMSKLSLISRTNLLFRCAKIENSLKEVSGVVYKHTCGSCKSSYYGETNRHLKVRCSEHIGISLTSKIKPSTESAIRGHLLICNNVPSFDEFSILAHGNNRFVFEIKESLLIKRDKPVWNKNISSARLFLFDN